jgi:hypothetical protein
MVEVNSSLATVTILDTIGVVVPPGAFRVEKLPTKELIVPTLRVLVLTLLALMLLAAIVLTDRALGRVKDDTASVEKVARPVLMLEELRVLIVRALGRVKLDTLNVEVVNIEVFTVDALSEETVKA